MYSITLSYCNASWLDKRMLFTNLGLNYFTYQNFLNK